MPFKSQSETLLSVFTCSTDFSEEDENEEVVSPPTPLSPPGRGAAGAGGPTGPGVTGRSLAPELCLDKAAPLVPDILEVTGGAPEEAATLPTVAVAGAAKPFPLLVGRFLQFKPGFHGVYSLRRPAVSIFLRCMLRHVKMYIV